MKPKKHLCRFISVLMLTFFCLFAVQSTQCSEPTYSGRALSEWLLELKKSPSSDEVLAGIQQHLDTETIYQNKKNQDENAIRQIGTNGIPTLLDILGAKNRNVKKVVLKLQSKELQEEYNYNKDAKVEDLRSLAVDGFAILGTNAESAVPQLDKLFHDSETRFQAIRALTKVGPAGFSVLTNALADKDSAVRNNLIWVIGEEGGGDLKVVTKLLINALKDPDSVNRGNAATFLAGKDSSAIPALIKLLDEDHKNFVTVTGAAKGLSSFGSAAKSAAPKLLSIYTNEVVSQDKLSARNWGVELMWALKAIDMDTAAKAETFLVNSSPLNYAREGYTTTLLKNGEKLIAGGYVHTEIPAVTNCSLSSAELLDPVTGKWAETGKMSTARYNHTATLLFNGKVLVSGGSDSRGNALSSAELYDPTTRTWTMTGLLNNTHSSDQAVLQPGGKVLVFSGGWYPGSPISNQELYDPTTGTWLVTNLTSRAK